MKIVKEGTALDNGPGGIEQAEELGQRVSETVEAGGRWPGGTSWWLWCLFA